MSTQPEMLVKYGAPYQTSGRMSSAGDAGKTLLGRLYSHSGREHAAGVLQVRGWDAMGH